MSHLLTKDEFKKRGISLSPQELRCLELASHDMPAKQIALNMNLAAGTVDKYLYHARNKLGVATTAGAVAIILRRKWIE